MTNDVVVSVGMGPIQLDFIKRLKELGFCVVAFGKGKNSEEAIKISDYSAEIDTRDCDLAIKWINSLNVRVVGVGSFAGGVAVHTVQKLSNYYKVSTSLNDSLLVGPDKEAQQKLLEQYGLSSIKTWHGCDLSPEIIESGKINKFVIKPAIGRGSEGIKIVTKKELVTMLKEKSSIDKSDVIQELKMGDEYRVVTIIQNGCIRLIAPILRKSFRNTVFLGRLSFCDKDYDRLLTLLSSFITNAKITNSIIKADIIVSDDSIDVIEMDIGVGGGTYYKRFVSEIYGRSLMDDYISLITDKEIPIFNPVHPHYKMDYVYNRSPYPIFYDEEQCFSKLSVFLKGCKIQINQLHPERKGGFSSNADFIFTVMYDDPYNTMKNFEVDDFVNESVFVEAKKDGKDT